MSGTAEEARRRSWWRSWEGAPPHIVGESTARTELLESTQCHRRLQVNAAASARRWEAPSRQAIFDVGSGECGRGWVVRDYGGDCWCWRGSPQARIALFSSSVVDYSGLGYFGYVECE